MRCSSCEPLLDRYLEGTLSPREMLNVRAHVQGCVHCTSLLDEVRVIDALLATTTPIELAPNFTFAVMAEAREVRMHAARRTPLWALLGTYVAVAWTAFTALLLVFGTHNPYLDALRGGGIALVTQIGTTMAIVTHSFGSSAPFVVGGVVTLLALDAAVAAAAFLAYRAFRARTQRPEAL